jgi:hypothetical protein
MLIKGELMQAIFYGIAIIGSFPIGYSLIRTILPEKQDSENIEKIAYGYALSLLVFIPAMIISLMVFEKFFFITTGIIYAILFTIFLAKRKMSNLVDEVELIEEKEETKIPKRVLTDEEKETNYQKIKPVNFKEQKNNFNKKKDITNKNNTSNKKNLDDDSPKKINVIESLREKTLEIKEKNYNEEKSINLDKLKDFAKQIEKKKSTTETINKSKKDDIDEKELEEIGNEEF